jgi:hypothetical protein
VSAVASSKNLQNFWVIFDPILVHHRHKHLTNKVTGIVIDKIGNKANVLGDGDDSGGVERKTMRDNFANGVVLQS